LTRRPGVGLVVDRELARVAEPLGLDAQHPRAGGVEGHDPHRAGAAPEQALDALAHLLGGLVGERDRQDLVGPGLPRVVEVGDAVGQHARLARAGAGEDEQRAVAVHDRLALGRVHPLEEAFDVLIGRGHGATEHRSEVGGSSGGRAT
jgi:hypothetical protein